MKNINKQTHMSFFRSSLMAFKGLLLISLIGLFLYSCNEDTFLDEEPLDFLSPTNSFVTINDFESAVFGLYANYRTNFWGQGGASASPRIMFSGTDLVMNDKDLGSSPPDWSALLRPTENRVSQVWVASYEIIFDANVIISRADQESSTLTSEQKNLIKGEASFFRGLAYRMLANMYGGVPVVLEEIDSPRRDFTRASREAVYEQAASDLSFAVQNLNAISATADHRVSKEAANHLLTEVLISLGNYSEAVQAASAVINNSDMGLMTERFGTRMNDPNFDGDVYWDLFRRGNQNRSTGNKEAIWVLQFEHLTEGGGDNELLLERFSIPRLWRANVKNNDGKNQFLVGNGPNTNYYGRGSGFQRPTPFFLNEIWSRSGDGDIRNSEHNIVRDFIINNPKSEFDGLMALADNTNLQLRNYADTARNFYPALAKNSTPGNHPQDLFASNQSIPGSLTSSGRQTFRDHYSMRLAETYLLRAEAYLGVGDVAAAAADINVVRRRSSAPEVMPGEVDIDYILDERLRELYYEEFRRLTLMRLGKLVERTRKYNPVFVGHSIQDHHDLWPVPFGEIEKNGEADLTQNPGY
jgi:hypothetical protein